MKKLYKIILLIIALALFISCDEKKAEDDIKKAFTKITDEEADVVDAVDKITPKPKGSGTLTNTEGEEAGGDTPPPLTKPAVDSYRVRVGQVATFPKVLGHTYILKETKTGVALRETEDNRMYVTTTQAATGVVVVATLDDSTEESDPIEFVEITKPVFFPAAIVSWNTPITFPKIPGYAYALKEKKTGVALREATSDTMQVTATQSAQNVIIVVTDNGLSVESDPIQFTRTQGNTLSFMNPLVTPTLNAAGKATHTQTATSDGTVVEDDREIVYSINGIGATIDSSSGKVDFTSESGRTIAYVTAELPQTEKYERSTARYEFNVLPHSK